MNGFLNRIRRRIGFYEAKIPEGEQGILQVGHRGYVGGLWDEIGMLQFDFLRSKGLQSSDVLLDIGCGSLRAGVHLIPFLDPGNYLGVEKEKKLVDLALQHELNSDIYESKKPEIVITKKFEFRRLSKVANVAIAQSLFTHLTAPLILSCLKELKENFDPNGTLYATFFIRKRKVLNPWLSHDHKQFIYSEKEVRQIGKKAGWQVRFIGDWGHPRNQQMVQFNMA